MTIEERIAKIEKIIEILVTGLESASKKANVYFLIKPLIENLKKELNNEGN